MDGLHLVPKLRKPAVEVSAFAQFVLNSQLNRLPFTGILNYRGLDFDFVGCGLWSEADFKSFLRNSDAGGSLSNHLTIQFKFKLEEEKESLNSCFHNLHCGVRSSLVGELTFQQPCP